MTSSVSPQLLATARDARSTFRASSGGGACIDVPAHLIAEETAKMGEEVAQFTSCDAIAEAGGCVAPEFKVKCCASCASASGVPMRMTYNFWSQFFG